MSDLGQVVDPRALDATEGAAARISIRVPADWAGRALVCVAPARLVCTRCDGGGCDACDRSGGFRLDGDESSRTFGLTLPEALGRGVALRLASPFGPDGPVALLRVDVRVDDAPSPGVRALPSRALVAPSRDAPSVPIGPIAYLAAAILLAIAVVFALR